ncbi:MAG: 3-mercaptopyruvate sulfurtransferase [Aquisalinus sp.]|nr:3-mercaptopyruvate sulfurtransferase [Aquisalinus sp.]
MIKPKKLFKSLAEPSLKIIDASWHLDTSISAEADFKAEHLPNAAFFDLDAVSDQSSSLPHMLPTSTAFQTAVEKLGISRDDKIVVYDSTGLFSAPRVWWTFRVMGAHQVQILDGGLPAWRQAGLPLESGPSRISAGGHFETEFDESRVISCSELQEAVENETAIILDARPANRFFGRAPEPRPSLKSGHICGSKSLPASQLITDGFMKSADELDKLFAEHAVTPDTDVIVSCGSGVTAAILALGLAITGHKRTRLYDGSWAEWGQLPDTFICQ